MPWYLEQLVLFISAKKILFTTDGSGVPLNGFCMYFLRTSTKRTLGEETFQVPRVIRIYYISQKDPVCRLIFMRLRSLSKILAQVPTLAPALALALTIFPICSRKDLKKFHVF
jgi:hypothetical protein